MPQQLSNEFSPLIPLLAEILGRTTDTEVKIRTVRAIGALGPHAAPLVPQLIPFLRSQGKVRQCAVEALGEIGSGAASAVPALIRILKSNGIQRDHAVERAALALGRIGDPAAVNPLTIAVDSYDAQGPAPFALDALARLAPKALSALPTLRKLREDKRYPWRANVDDTIKKIEGFRIGEDDGPAKQKSIH